MPILQRLLGQRRPARLPDGARVYAVGDIHGRDDLLHAMEQRIVADLSRYPPPGEVGVIFLGDYVDRGPGSRAVVERLSAGAVAGLPTRCLLGNHEHAMLRFLDDPLGTPEWLDYGGRATLGSYGVDAGWAGDAESPERLVALGAQAAAAIPPAHLAFLHGLETCIELGGFLFVHAGIRPGVPLARQRRRDLLFIREPFLSTRRRLSHRVVHGHTISDLVEVLPHRVGVDTGAYRTGQLGAVVIEGENVAILA